MDKFKIRLYVKENKEVYEIIDKNSNKLIHKYVFRLGQTFVDFIYSDFTSFNNLMTETELAIKELRKINMNNNEKMDRIVSIANSLVNNHIFYYIFAKRIYDEVLRDYDIPNSKPSYNHTFAEIGAFKVQYYEEIIPDFVKKCLADNTNKKELMANKFNAMLNRHLTTSSICEDLKIPASEHSYYPEKLYNYNIFTNDKPKLSTIIFPAEIEDIFNYLMVQQLQNRLRYKKCKNCGKYFVLSGHKGVEYCDRFIDETGRTCKDIGAMAKYRNKKNDDPIFKAYNKAYKTKNARIRYGIITHDQFNEWSKNARIMRDKCYSGEIELKFLISWLNSDYGFTGEFMNPNK